MIASTGPATSMYRLTSCRANRNFGFESRCETFESLPVTRLSMQRTSQPFSSINSQRCEPRNPAPPVMTARKLFAPFVRLIRAPVRGVHYLPKVFASLIDCDFHFDSAGRLGNAVV